MRAALFDKRKLREKQKNGETLFLEAMYEFDMYEPKKSFAKFRKAAEKGHKESLWIWNVVKDILLGQGNKDVFKEAFAKTECPMGWYWAGESLSDDCSKEKFDYYKKSSCGGYSWGQMRYAMYYATGPFVISNQTVYIELMEKAMAQNNPRAMYFLGNTYKYGEESDYEKAQSYYLAASELGCKWAMKELVYMYYHHHIEMDFIHAIQLSSIEGNWRFYDIFRNAFIALKNETTSKFGHNFDLFMMEMGKGLYWYQYGTYDWKYELSDDERKFGEKCLDYYCFVIELQQEGIFLFLNFWNKTVGIKDIGKIIAKQVWDMRYEHPVLEFKK